MRVVVIGGGLFGSIIAHRLSADHCHKVTVIDAEHENRGSTPAACLMKPAWISSLPKEQVRQGLEILDALFGLHDIIFRVYPVGAHHPVHWVNPRRIMGPDALGRSQVKHVHGEVKGIVRECGDGFCVQYVNLPDLSLGEIKCDRVIVAAGVWTFSVLQRLGLNKPYPEMKRMAGCARLFPGEIDQPFIKPWAPYKQIVAFSREPALTWVGDGASILDRNWGKTHESKNLIRCSQALPGKSYTKRLFGLRPYVDGHKPCYIAEEAPGIWAVTGGAKNGTIAAAISAWEIGKNL